MEIVFIYLGLLIVGLVGYFIPTWIGVYRQHPRIWILVIANAGVFVCGPAAPFAWVVCLIYSLWKTEPLDISIKGPVNVTMNDYRRNSG